MAITEPSRTPSKIGALRNVLLALLHEHQRDGALPTNARFLYYELVQRGLLSKERTGARRPDQDLHDALTDIREDGRVPWNWIVDETRSVENYTGYGSIKQGLLEVLPSSTLDPWRGQAPLILTESRSLAGVLRSLAREYRAFIAPPTGRSAASCTPTLHRCCGLARVSCISATTICVATRSRTTPAAFLNTKWAGCSGSALR
jgi:hypothetical protein